MVWRDPGEDRDLIDDLGEPLVVQLVELRAGQDPALPHVELRGDGSRRVGVVAGDHDRAHAGSPHAGDGLGRRLAHRVGQDDEADELEAVQPLGVDLDAIGRRSLRDGDDAPPS